MRPLNDSLDNGSGVGYNAHLIRDQAEGPTILNSIEHSNNHTQSLSPSSSSASQEHSDQAHTTGMQRNGSDGNGIGYASEPGHHQKAVFEPQIPPGSQQDSAYQNTPSITTNPTKPTMTPEASELKAKLKAKLAISKSRRASSHPIAVQTQKAAAGQSSLRGSPQTSNLSTLEDLISAASKLADDGPEPAATKLSDQSPSAENGSLENATSFGTNGTAKMNGHGKLRATSYKSSRHGSPYSSHGSVSEGEILEDAPVLRPKITRPTGPLERPKSKQINDYHVTDGSREITNNTGILDPQVSHREVRTDAKNKKPLDERRETEHTTSRPESRSAEGIGNRYNGQRRYSNAETPDSRHMDTHERVKEPLSRSRTSEDPARRATALGPVRQPSEPTLIQLLPYDEDLRQWLDITGYHNEPYRSKILERRRRLAKLDAEKALLLEEIKREERGVPPTNVALNHESSTVVDMAPPPVPGKAGSPNGLEIESLEERSRDVSNKRSYSDIQDASDQTNISKSLRLDDRIPRTNPVEDVVGSRIRPPGSDLYKAAADHSEDHSYFIDNPGSRRTSRERADSPSSGMRAYENRPPARRYEEDGHDDWKQAARDTRPFEVVGGYKGRAFDPNYRGRGKANSSTRRRGDHQSREQSRDRDFGSNSRDHPPPRDLHSVRGRGGSRGDFRGRGGPREADFAAWIDEEHR